jgi:hypothetical protein
MFIELFILQDLPSSQKNTDGFTNHNLLRLSTRIYTNGAPWSTECAEVKWHIQLVVSLDPIKFLRWRFGEVILDHEISLEMHCHCLHSQDLWCHPTSLVRGYLIVARNSMTT